jgi:uncharacterized protein YjbJ (UPF0337 family)
MQDARGKDILAATRQADKSPGGLLLRVRVSHRALARCEGQPCWPAKCKGLSTKKGWNPRKYREQELRLPGKVAGMVPAIAGSGCANDAS